MTTRSSVLRRLLDVIDNQELKWRLGGDKLHSQLLFERAFEVEPFRIGRGV